MKSHVVGARAANFTSYSSAALLSSWNSFLTDSFGNGMSQYSKCPPHFLVTSSKHTEHRGDTNGMSIL